MNGLKFIYYPSILSLVTALSGCGSGDYPEDPGVREAQLEMKLPDPDDPNVVEFKNLADGAYVFSSMDEIFTDLASKSSIRFGLNYSSTEKRAIDSSCELDSIASTLFGSGQLQMVRLHLNLATKLQAQGAKKELLEPASLAIEIKKRKELTKCNLNVAPSTPLKGYLSTHELLSHPKGRIYEHVGEKKLWVLRGALKKVGDLRIDLHFEYKRKGIEEVGVIHYQKVPGSGVPTTKPSSTTTQPSSLTTQPATQPSMSIKRELSALELRHQVYDDQLLELEKAIEKRAVDINEIDGGKYRLKQVSVKYKSYGYNSDDVSQANFQIRFLTQKDGNGFYVHDDTSTREAISRFDKDQAQNASEGRGAEPASSFVSSLSFPHDILVYSGKSKLIHDKMRFHSEVGYKLTSSWTPTVVRTDSAVSFVSMLSSNPEKLENSVYSGMGPGFEGRIAFQKTPEGFTILFVYSIEADTAVRSVEFSYLRE